MNPTSNSGARKALPHVGWSLYVGLYWASFHSHSVSRNPGSWVSKPDGSSSLLLASSGVSFEVVNPTGGQFGYVVMGAFFRSRGPLSSESLLVSLGLILSLGRFISLRASPRS